MVMVVRPALMWRQLRHRDGVLARLAVAQAGAVAVHHALRRVIDSSQMPVEGFSNAEYIFRRLDSH